MAVVLASHTRQGRALTVEPSRRRPHEDFRGSGSPGAPTTEATAVGAWHHLTER